MPARRSWAATRRPSALSGLTSRHGCGFLCEHAFRAYIWFHPVDPRGDGSAIEPEWIDLFGIDEPLVGRWSASRHAVFSVLTGRANAVVRYF